MNPEKMKVKNLEGREIYNAVTKEWEITNGEETYVYRQFEDDNGSEEWISIGNEPFRHFDRKNPRDLEILKFVYLEIHDWEEADLERI